MFWRFFAGAALLTALAVGIVWLALFQLDSGPQRDAALSAFASTVPFIVMGGLVSSAAVAAWLSATVKRPLTQLEAAAAAAARGEYGTTLPVHAPLEEITRVGRAIEAMRSELMGSIEELRADKQGLASVLSSMQEGVIACDAASRILQVNRAAGVLLGITPLALGKPLGEAVRNPDILSAFTQGLQKPTASETELPGNPPLVVQVQAAPLALPGGGGGAVLVIHDVTELRRLETVRRDFVANVSHELKTPLTAIKGYVETLIDGAMDDARVSGQFLGKIHDNAERLCNLTNDLLTLARLEAEQGETGERYSPDDRVQRVFKALEDKAGKKSITFELQLGAASARVDGDADSFEQAVLNLMDNAINYTPSGGKVRVITSAGSAGYSVSVADTGIGIPESEQHRIFERFYRVDKARSRDAGGTGLGLAIVRHVALMHRGTITLQSRTGEGSTFTLTLPLSQQGGTPNDSARSSAVDALA